MVGALPCIGTLVQVRGDWAWYKQMFQFPSWSNKEICWLCRANTSNRPYWDFSLSAAWRANRWTDETFWRKMRQEGIAPSCLFGLPGVTRSSITIDVLHALDLGCSQDIVGNLIFAYIESGCCPGPNRDARVAAVWGKLKAHYTTLKTPNRLQNLTTDMIKQPKKGPKLRAKGAEQGTLYPLLCSSPRRCTMHFSRPRASRSSRW